MHLEKHPVNVIPRFRILMARDVREPAYYPYYTNDRARFTGLFFTVVTRDKVNKRLITLPENGRK